MSAPYVIAAIGTNHGGDYDDAIELVELACQTNADAVKMQHIVADTLVDDKLMSLAHNKSSLTMRERFKSLELPFEAFKDAKSICEYHRKDFIITPFDVASVEKCAAIADKIKISSGDLTYEPLLKEVAKNATSIILSTGMATLDEIYKAVEIFDTRPALLHCVSLYPTPPNKVNMRSISYLREFYPEYDIGYSDHCIGNLACIVAASVGAEIIEKHFTSDHSKTVGDHLHSLDPSEMDEMIAYAKEARQMLGIPSAKDDLHMRESLRRGDSGLRGDWRPEGYEKDRLPF